MNSAIALGREVLDIPSWWHSHGDKMSVRSFAPKIHLVIAGSAATLTIKRAPPEVGDGMWHVSWRVVQFAPEPFTEEVWGRRIFTGEELLLAFGRPNSDGPSSLHEERQGKFIRLGNFLNIPCPGTGHDGDPNVSVYLTDEIRAAVSGLLSP